jgi:FkbM family methyltransferase
MIQALDTVIGGYAKHETERYALIHGKYWMRLDLRGSMDRVLYHNASHEIHVVKMFTDLLDDAEVVFDIGAHVGFYTMIAAEKLNTSGRVYSFEADPAIFRYLKSNVEINDYQNVIANKLAVASKSGTASFYSSRRYHGGTGSLIQNTESHQEPIIVRTVSLDDYVKGANLDRLDLIKIDVEGAELDVLKGAIETLKRLKPRIICEVGLPGRSGQDAVNRALIELEQFASICEYSAEIIAHYHGLPHVLLTQSD